MTDILTACGNGQSMEDFGGLSYLGGEIFWVAPTSSAVYDKWAGKHNFYTTIAAAYAATVTNRNDVIMLSPDAHTVTSMLTVAKNRIHFMGADVSGRKFGQSAKIYIGVTTAATDIAAAKVTGVRNSFTNIKFYSDNTVAQSLYCVAENGEYTVYRNCEFYKSTDLDTAQSAELLANGDSTTYIDCTFGSIADAVSGDIIRSCVSIKQVLGPSRDVHFFGCEFWRSAGGTTTPMVYSAAANDVERLMLFKDCIFVNSRVAAATPAVAISCAATLTTGQILCKDCVALRCTKLATATGVFLIGGSIADTTGLPVQGT